MLNIDFPDHNGFGPFTSGGGRSPTYPAAASSLPAFSLVRNVSLAVNRKDALSRSLIAPIIGPPYLGDNI